MSILRPQQAASECERLAAEMARLKRISAGEAYRLFSAQQKFYERRRDYFVRKYGIKCSPLTSTHQGSPE